MLLSARSRPATLLSSITHSPSRFSLPALAMKYNTVTVPNRAKAALADDEVFSSMSIKLCSSVEIVGIAKAAGFEAILLDMEHNAFSLSTANQVRFLCPSAPLSRGVTDNPLAYSSLAPPSLTTLLVSFAYQQTSLSGFRGVLTVELQA